MAQVLIRNVDPRLVEIYKARAARNGRSLEQELRELLRRYAPFTPEEARATSAELHARTRKGPLAPMTLDDIRDGLE